MCEDAEYLYLDGLDHCIVGVCRRFGQEDILIYDYNKIIDELTVNAAMSYEDAVDHIEYNMIGAWMGDKTPAFLHEMDDE